MITTRPTGSPIARPLTNFDLSVSSESVRLPETAAIQKYISINEICLTPVTIRIKNHIQMCKTITIAVDLTHSLTHIDEDSNSDENLLKSS